MRVLGTLIVAALLTTSAVALPRAPLAPQDGVTLTENRLLPRFLGGGRGEREEEAADTALRIQQLEDQVRALTGQVEELTFAVRSLQAAQGVGDGGLSQPPGSAPTGVGATQGVGAAGAGLPTDAANTGETPSDGLAGDGGGATVLGAPPRDLGTLPADAATDTPASGATGPIDLSALNRGPDAEGSFAGGETSNNTVAAAPTAIPPDTAGDGALADVRALQDSGRYGMAAASARELLDSNPPAPVANEARYLLGEALLAQGEYRGAANLFLENYTADPNGNRAPANLLRLGTALNSLDEREAACSSLEELFGAYPNMDPSLRAEAEQQRQAANCV